MWARNISHESILTEDEGKLNMGEIFFATTECFFFPWIHLSRYMMWGYFVHQWREIKFPSFTLMLGLFASFRPLLPRIYWKTCIFLLSFECFLNGRAFSLFLLKPIIIKESQIYPKLLFSLLGVKLETILSWPELLQFTFLRELTEKWNVLFSSENIHLLSFPKSVYDLIW